jgi:hypothetical protein
VNTGRWLPYAAIVAFYITLYVVGRLWLQPLLVRELDAPGKADQRRWAALSERVRYENERLREIMVRDSLRPLIPAHLGVSINVRSDDEVYVRRAVQREVTDSPRAALAVFEVPQLYGAHPHVRDHVFHRRFYVNGESGGLPYCAVALPQSDWRGANKRRAEEIAQRGVLGPCLLWGRYGAPGPAVRRWLETEGLRFARRDVQVGVDFSQIEDLRPFSLRRDQMRALLPIDGQACLSGQLDKCSSAILSSSRSQVPTEFGMSVPRLFLGESYLLHTLEREFGNERFAKFWQSDQPVEVAFRSAFGIDLGTWVYRWMKPLGHFRAGASLSGISLILTLLFLGILTGAVLVAAQHRQV